jgi:hypothetical protein
MFTAHPLPRYRQVVKRVPPQTRRVKQWTHDSAETLRGCFENTDWDAFFDDETDYDRLTDAIT